MDLNNDTIMPAETPVYEFAGTYWVQSNYEFEGHPYGEKIIDGKIVSPTERRLMFVDKENNAFFDDHIMNAVKPVRAGEVWPDLY